MKPSLWILLALGVLCTTATAKKRFKDPEKCGKPTCKVSAKFNYKERTDYIYKYSASASTRFDGASEDSANTTLSFLVHLQFRTKCEGIIKLSEIELFSGVGREITPVENEKLQLLEKNILRFYYDDGNIAEICPEDEEPVWVLNIKRSVLSALQNTMDRFDVDQYLFERDINGDCAVGYFFKEVDQTTLVIDKKLDVSSCVNRYQIYSIIPMTPYIFQRKYHKWTPMNSTVFCVQHIDHKVLTEVSCEEHHQFQPFYNQSNGAKSRGKTKLRLLSEEALPIAEIETLKRLGEVHDRQNLLFDHKRPTRASDDNLNECKQLLRSLCDINMMEFKPKYTEYFNRFIHVGRDLSVPALRQLYNETEGLCPTAGVHMMDALPYIRSRAATDIMTDIINERKIDNATISEWLLIMTFYPRPDGELVGAAMKLLSGGVEAASPQTLLTVTTIVHNFCERSPACGSHPAVLDAVHKIQAAVVASCRDARRTHAYSGLKALGNAGVITPTLNLTLASCINNPDLPLDMRVEAINTHRRLPCETNRLLLLKLFKDKTADAELRIAAYMQLMRCPSYAILRAIRASLIMEEFNQVGSFVWSHLKTQMKSSFPARVEVQAILQDEHLGDKFNKDFRKFSRNYETSFYLNRYGIGVFLETNVIFSYKSYVPRTLTFNGTISVFGETLNVFEVTLFFQGLEVYLDEIFNVGKLIDKKLIDSVVKLIRRIRSVSSLQELINEIPYIPILDHVKVSVSLKMFGNEVNYFTIHGMEELKYELNKLNPMKIIRNFFSGQEIDFTKSSMLVDVSYVTPMMIGVPLKLNAIGTAAVKFDAEGFINASRLRADSELDIKGRLVPSLGVSLACYFGADSFVASAGAMFKGTIYTSTAIEGTFKMRSLRFVQVAFNLPLDKSDIVHAETHLLLTTERKEVELRGATGDRPAQRYCSWNLVDETIGLRMCANTLLPDADSLLRSPIFFLSGPLQLGVTLEKSDTTAKLFILEYKIDTINNKTVLVFNFDTPGSVTRRGLKAVVDLDPQSQNLTLAYQSSLTTVQAQGYYRNTANEMLINFGLDINGQKHIDIQIGVEIQNGTTGHQVAYYPKLLFAINSKRVVELKGNITYVRKSEISQYQINLDLATNRFETLISGYGRLTDVSVATNLRMDYRFANGSQQTVRFEIILGNKSTKFLASYLGHLQLESTAYPEVNLILAMTFQKAQSHTDCHINMVTNPYTQEEKQKLRVRWHYQLYKTYVFEKRNMTLEIIKPSSNVDLKFAFFRQTTAATFTSVVIVKYAKGKEVVITFDLHMPHGAMFYFDSRLKVLIPAASEQASCFMKIFEKAPRDYDLEFVGAWFSGHNLTMRGMYQDRSDPYISSHTIKVLARSQFFDDLLLTGRFINWESEVKTDVQVEYKESSYGLGLAHKNEVEGIYETFGELVYDGASYTFTSHIDLIAHRTRLDLHLDTYRDLNIALHGNSNKTKLEAGLHVKWDANRDPSQKLNALILVNSHGNLNSDGRIILEYPGRTIKSSFTTLHESIDYSLIAKVEWSPKSVIIARLKGIYDMDFNKTMKLDGEVETPFANWEYTSLNYQMKIGSQDIKSNGSVVWQTKQRVDLDVSAGYNFTEEESIVYFISTLESSIPEISAMRGIVRYEQIPDKITFGIVLQSSPLNLVVFDVAGETRELVDKTQYMFKLGMITPFESLRYARAIGELNVCPMRRFKGHLHFIERVEGVEKKYMTTVDGSFKQLRESNFNFHVGTPVERWKHLTARYAFSASKRHFIADLKSPAVALGTELVFIYNNLTNFDLKLKAYASVTGVKNLIIVGKRDVDTMDVRLGWDKLMVGLVGRTHYTNWSDVDYSLQVFTPFEGYQQASAIAKLLYSDRLDLEIYLNAGNKKVGVKVQGMKKPDREFAVPFSIEERNQTVAIEPFDFEEVEDGTTFARGVFQLDTSLYPTVHGFLQVNDYDGEYTTLSYVSFPFGQLKLTDNLNFIDLLNFKNNLQVLTSCKCFEKGTVDFSIQGVLSRNISSTCDFSALVFNETYKGDAKSDYKYMPVSEENDSEGTYNITVEMSSPFQMMRRAFTNLHLHAVSPVYVGNLTVEINNSSLYTDGTLENDGSIFITDLGVKMDTPLLMLPMCRLMLSKDFTDFEKEINVGLAFPNQKGDSLVHYGVSVAWHYDGPKYMKYILAITTPIPSVGTIRSSVLYSSDVEEEEYFLELYLKYAEKKEITAWNSVRRDVFNFHVISTHEAFRNISLNGNLKRSGPHGEKRSLDAVLSLDREYKMYGSAIISNRRPFVMDVKLLKTATGEPVFVVNLKIQKKSNRYDISSLIQRFQNRINVLCDYIIVEDVGKLLNLMLTSTYPGYEKLIVYGEFLADESEEELKARVTKIQGEVVSKWITTAAQLNLNVSLGESLGVVSVELHNKNISLDAEVAWLNKPLEHMLLQLSGSGSYLDMRKSLEARLHLWNMDNEFSEMSVSSDINYNLYEWWLSANATMLWPFWHDLEFVSHAILPHKTEDHHVSLVKVHFDKSFNYSALVLKYKSNPKKFNFEAITEFSLESEDKYGLVLVKTGKHKIYDRLEVSQKEKEYDVRNVLQSTNLKEDLITDITYRKPDNKHHVRMVIYYPEPNSVMNAVVNFSALNNLQARINCSTPFKAFPNIRVLLKLITTKPFYQRFGEILWANQSAVFNYSHASSWEEDIQLTDGEILVDFPLATRHRGVLDYHYKSTLLDAVGYAGLRYNWEHIMSGNYSRQSEFTDTIKNELIRITVNNSFLPTGINYINNYSREAVDKEYPNWHFKRVELYKLNETNAFNITGEMEVKKNSEVEKNTTLRALHSHRKLIIDTVDDGKGYYQSEANFTLKQDIWVSGGLMYIARDDVPGRDMQVYAAYPRRYFRAKTYYNALDDSFHSEIHLQPNLYKTNTTISNILTWTREPHTKNHNISVILGHPSFVKNLTLEGRYSKSMMYPGKIDLDFMYSSDINKKVSFYSFVKNISTKPVFHYEYTAYGDHPSSRLRLTGFGYLKVLDKIIDIQENITYKRSYQPLSFWYNAFKVDLREKRFQIERNSLRDLAFMEGRYSRKNATHTWSGTLITGNDVHIIGNLFLDPENHLTNMLINLTEDGREQLRMEGFYRDHRHTALNLWRQYEEVVIPDFTFLTRLNHSRLLTIAFLWRPEIRSDLIDSIYGISSYITTYASDTVNFWTQYFKTELYDSAMDIWFDAKPNLQDFLDDIRDVDDLEEDIEIFKKHFQKAYDENEFYMQDIYKMYMDMTEEMSFKDRMAHVPKILNELWEVMGETGETIRKSILWLVESVKKVYNKVVEFIRGLVTGETIDNISESLQKIAGKYDKMIRDMHISFLHYVEQLWNESLASIQAYWSKTLATVEPTFIQFAAYVESTFWDFSKKVFEFLYARQTELLKSSVFAKNSNLTKNLDAFYEDITKNDFITNLKKYSQMLIDLVREQYFSIVPFGYELNEIGTEIVGEMKELYKLPLINFTMEFTREIYSKGRWIYDYFNIQERIQQFLPFMYKMMVDYSHTALENEMINHGVRTKFMFEPDRGQIMLEEKLPMPWHAFNETPNYKEIPEYKIAAAAHRLLSPSNFSIMSYYYKLAPLTEPLKWLPPFGVQAVLIGNKHLVTFDGNHLELTNDCTYLLSHDFLNKTFSFVSRNMGEESSFVLITNNSVITVDLQNKVISVDGDKNLHLPVQIGLTSIIAEESSIKVENELGFSLLCHFKFETCYFTLSGWYFGKVSGLLGTMDNEPRTDMFKADGEMAKNLDELAESWELGPCKHTVTPAPSRNSSSTDCYSLYHSKSSQYSACFSVVDPAPYSNICYERTKNKLNDPVCSSAFAYLLSCRENFVPLKLPSYCITCPLPYGESLQEGDFTKMEGPMVPQSSDVVLVLEAKECNQYMRDRRMVHTFVSILTREFAIAGLTDNRYAVVIFGGDGVFDQPHSVVVKNQVFTSEKDLPNYFENIESGNGNSDIFAALRYATKLQYRAGVSKTFILIPCSNCDLANMTVEYNVLNQAFMEQNITLHVLMNADFDYENLKVSKMFYGLDSKRAYTKNDFKALKGDTELRRQIKLTKSMMGYCTSLALETNGTIFTGKRMGSEYLAQVKKFSSVFARRIAASAHPDSCQSCECVGDDNGVDFIDCIPCSIPVPAYSDFEFQENGTLSSIWPAIDNLDSDLAL